ncbi:class I SAM-dependent methyltransferase [Streptosporangium sp. KLBMP 9127]|nr:class I SAM-dependent methyltransferase [Streptosporangium sp. KLBMP 9127]
MWSGDPNAMLVRAVSGLEPGRALDLGCGEGGDAIWLARQDWWVTATDISGVALERAAKLAADAEVGERVDWQRHDLARSFPEGTFDLVTASFLYSMHEMPRETILRTAAAAVAPGGVLLILGHAGRPSWERDDHHVLDLPTPREVLDALELPAGQWEVQLCEEYERVQNDPDGRPGVRTDNVVKVRRKLT